MAIIFVIVTTYVIVNLRRKLYGGIEVAEKIASQKHDERFEKNIGMVTLCYLLGGAISAVFFDPPTCR